MSVLDYSSDPEGDGTAALLHMTHGKEEIIAVRMVLFCPGEITLNTAHQEKKHLLPIPTYKVRELRTLLGQRWNWRIVGLSQKFRHNVGGVRSPPSQ